jgi:hypothetical protein
LNSGIPVTLKANEFDSESTVLKGERKDSPVPWKSWTLFGTMFWTVSLMKTNLSTELIFQVNKHQSTLAFETSENPHGILHYLP